METDGDGSGGDTESAAAHLALLFGQYSWPVFEFAHLYLWEMLIILDAIVVFGFWSRRAVTEGSER